MNERTQFVFFATYAKPSSMRRAVAYRLAERSPVVVVREPISLLRDLCCSGLRKRLKRSNTNALLREYTPLHFPERVPVIGKPVKMLGAALFRRELRRVLADYKGGSRVVLYDSPRQFPLVGTLGEELSVYLAIDDRTVTVWGQPIAGEQAAERNMLSRVDRVICVSESLAETLRARMPVCREIIIDVLTNGYDERLFAPTACYEEPVALKTVPRPRVLVAGHVSERIDWTGIASAARLRPEWSWVFVGPADCGMEEKVCDIRATTNGRLFLQPAVSHETIPAWIAHCDACAVPYRLNQFTRASSPLKALEYLGAGAPVLSTEIPSLRVHKDAIDWVREADGASYAAALDAMRSSGRSPRAVERRVSAVSGETWARKAQRFRDLLGH